MSLIQTQQYQVAHIATAHIQIHTHRHIHTHTHTQSQLSSSSPSHKHIIFQKQRAGTGVWGIDVLGLKFHPHTISCDGTVSCVHSTSNSPPLVSSKSLAQLHYSLHMIRLHSQRHTRTKKAVLRPVFSCHMHKVCVFYVCLYIYTSRVTLVQCVLLTPRAIRTLSTKQ